MAHLFVVKLLKKEKNETKTFRVKKNTEKQQIEEMVKIALYDDEYMMIS